MAKNTRETTTRRNAGSPDLGWLENPDELPRADIGLQDRASRRQKTYKIAVVAVLFVGFPLSVLSNLSMLPKILDAKPAVAAPASLLTSETKPAAMLAVQNWLAQKPSPLPGGSLLSWDGVDIQAKPELITDADTNQTVEKQGMQLHHMTVAAATGQVFETTVQVAYSPFRGSQVIGIPTLIPRAPDEKGIWQGLQTWTSLAKVTPSDPVIQSVSAWVKSFTSGDPNALRLTVGDQAENRSYVPLSQATATDVQIIEVGARNDTKGDTAAKPSQVVARISFAIVWNGQALERSQTPSRISYDILINRADGAAPVVVAWGGVGTGESLTEYMNAVENRKLTGDGLEKSVTTVSPKPAAAPEAPAAPAAVLPTVGANVPPAPTTGK